MKLLTNTNLIVYLFALLTGWMNAFGQLTFANDDFVNVSEDVSVRANVLHNDDGDQTIFDLSSFRILLQAQFGMATIDTSMIIYTPRSDFFGRDSFYYEICKSGGDCDQAMVRVQVHDINDAPIAVNDLDTLDEDTGILLNVLQNDADLADDIIAEHHAMHLVQMPNHGDLQIDGDQLIYTPKPNYYGNDYLRYAFCDQALCDTAMVRIHVRSINDEPIAKDDYLNTLSDLLLVFDPLINDHDSLDMEILDWSIISTEGLRQPSHGFTFVDLQVGLMIYVPDLGFVGADTFEYQVCDQGPDTILCDIALVYVSVYSPALSKPHLTPDLWETVRSGPQRHSSARIITEQQLQKVLKTHSAQEDLSPGNYRYIPDHPLGLVPQTY